MDIFAHTLWVGAGIVAIGRHRPIAPRMAAATIALAAVPDVLHLLPIFGWWVFGEGSASALWAYAVAVPGSEPELPPSVAFWSHHLHCVAHSAIVAAALTLVIWAWRRMLWVPLLGWWSHIVIDVFTHSADYYAAPVLYPLTERGFDGLAWNTPWFMLLNYLLLAAAGLTLWFRRTRDRRR